MSKGDAKAPSQRQLRVGEELRHAVAWILERGEIRDPGLGDAPVTVTEVRVSPDLRYATAYVMPLGGGDTEPVIAALNRAAPFVRRRIGRDIKLRYLPNLRFVADTTFDQAQHIDELLRNPAVARDLDAADDVDGGNNDAKDDGDGA
jgi:ribosome-binding factor A